MQLKDIIGPAHGKYKGVVNYFGILLGLEHLAGEVNPHSKLRTSVSYGDIIGSQGVDGDPVDIVLGSDLDSEKIWVLQDAHRTDTDASEGDIKQYGEDKIAIGFKTEAAARQGHADYYQSDDRKIVGAIASTVDEIRARVTQPEMEGVAWFSSALGKSIKTDNLVKAGDKPPKGFTPIPKGKHRGFRKHSSKGGYDYWYPAQHHHDHHDHWEEDYTLGTGVHSEAKAGHFFKVRGRAGTFVWTPDAVPKHPDGTVVLTPYNPEIGHASGEPQIINSSSVVGLKGGKKKSKPKRPKGLSGKGGARISRKPNPKRKAIPRGRRDAPPTETGDTRERAKVYKNSTAKAGTILEKLEGGHYPLVSIRDDHFEGRRTTKGVDIPQPEQAALLKEFEPLIEGAIASIAKQWHVPKVDGTGQLTDDYESLRSGALMGFVLAMRSYDGGRPFVPIAQDYTRTYANRAAQQTIKAGGASVPRSHLQLVHGLIAARNRARKGEAEPTPESVAKQWHATKASIFSNRKSLGSYDNGEKIVDQSREQLPMEDWHIVSPDGTEHGSLHAGKLSMIARLQPLMDGDRLRGSEWMERHDEGLLPHGAHQGMAVGTAHHLQSEVSSIIGRMSADNAQVLQVLFNFDGKGQAFSSDSSRISDLELAQRLKLKEGSSDRTKIRAGAEARQQAVGSFKRHAQVSRSEARRYADIWSKPKSVWQPPENQGPSHAELREKLGNDERVSLMQAGIAMGRSKEVEKILLKEKAGKATSKESRLVRTIFHDHRNEQRLEMFKLHAQTFTVDPSEVFDTGVGATESREHLMIADVLDGAAQAIMAGAHLPTSTSRPRSGKSKVMTDEKFARFMGRE